MINQKFMKLCTLQDPNMKMCTLVVYPGPSSFPRIMSLKVVFIICFGSIKMMGTQGVLVPVSMQDSCVHQYLQFLTRIANWHGIRKCYSVSNVEWQSCVYSTALKSCVITNIIICNLWENFSINNVELILTLIVESENLTTHLDESWTHHFQLELVKVFKCQIFTMVGPGLTKIIKNVFWTPQYKLLQISIPGRMKQKTTMF